MMPLVRTLLAAAALGAVSVAASAQQSPTAGSVDVVIAAPAALPLLQSPNDFMTRPTLTGDWDGLRTQLHQSGFDFAASYVNEYARSFSGGQRIGGGDFAQQFTFGALVDMEKFIGLAGGTFAVTFNAREGRSTSADFIGNKLAVQEVYGAGEDFRLGEFSYAQDLAGKLLNVKAGYYAMGYDFGTTPILCGFQNTGFCSHPQSLPNDSGWSDYPTAKWGGRVRVNLAGGVYAEAGVYDVNPTYTLPGNGLKISLSGSTGALIPVELGKTLALGPGAEPGHYKLGAYYDTSTVAGASGDGDMHSGRYGVYILADQMVWRFAPGTDRGLILVANGSLSEAKTAQIPTWFLSAVVARGLFAARPADFMGIGYIHAWVNHAAIEVQDAKLTAEGVASPMLELGENIVEVSYGFQATPWMLIHPNVQYIGNPGAFAFKHIPDAWVFGLQTKLVF